MFLGLSSEGVEALTKTSLDKSGKFDLDYSYQLQLGVASYTHNLWYNDDYTCNVFHQQNCARIK